MNKLLIPNGGMPFQGDDLTFMQEGIRDALKGIYHDFIKPYFGNVLLSGCDVTSLGSNQYSITEGYCIIQYEVCYVPAHTVMLPNIADASLKLEVTYDPTGLEVFADSISKNTYEVRRAKVTTGRSLGADVNIQNPVRLSNILGSNFEEYRDQPDYTGIGSYNLQVYRQGRILYFSGTITSTNINAATINLASIIDIVPSYGAQFMNRAIGPSQQLDVVCTYNINNSFTFLLFGTQTQELTIHFNNNLILN